MAIHEVSQTPFGLSAELRAQLRTEGNCILGTAQQLSQSIRDHLLTDAGHATIGKLLDAREDTTIIINPERWLSWNGGGLMDRIIELGGDVEAHLPATWFQDLDKD